MDGRTHRGIKLWSQGQAVNGAGVGGGVRRIARCASGVPDPGRRREDTSNVADEHERIISCRACAAQHRLASTLWHKRKRRGKTALHGMNLRRERLASYCMT
eukprot:6182081-Pleurochrysis_carterae.AAC.3